MTTKTAKVAASLGAPAGVADAISAAVEKYGIRNVPEFIAQMVVESKNFTAVVENMSYSAKRMAEVWPARYATDATRKLSARDRQPNAKAVSLAKAGPRAIANDVYGGRMGNTGPDDGWLYRGQGYKQLTGKDNVRRYSLDTYGDDRVVRDPAMLQRLPDAVNSGGWYWKTNRIDRYGDDILAVSRAVNLGTVNTKATPNGYDARVSATERARKLWREL
jgi:putative chitinase